MCGPGPIFVRTLAVGTNKHALEIGKNGEVRMLISCNSSQNMIKKEISNKKKISGPINYNKQTKKFFIFAIFKGKIEVCAKKSLKNMF